MKRSMGWLMAGLVLCAVTVTGQDIISFQNGYLTFENTDTNLYYRIEFRPNLTGSEVWSSHLPMNIKTSDAEVTVPAGMFYRVVGSQIPASMPATVVQKTGQTISYRTGDDGDRQEGAAWPDPRFTDHGDGTVTDNLTELMWVKAPVDLDVMLYKFWHDSIDFCNDLDFAGYSDWRLPNRFELESLLDLGRVDPALPLGHPFHLEPGVFWSSTTWADLTTQAWQVRLYNGFADVEDKEGACLVWPVRSVMPSALPSGMVRIPGGTNAGTDPDGRTYSLTVDTFYMDETSVTKAQWEEVFDWAVANGYNFSNIGSGKATNHPVHTVDWYDVVKWCNARSEKEGRTPVYTVDGEVYKTGCFGDDGSHVVECDFHASGYRLPTREEWEYGARGGLMGKRFPWGNTISHDQANYRADGGEAYCESTPAGDHPEFAVGGKPYTSPVGSFAANGYGLYDMVGNVSEWCWDLQESKRHLVGGSSQSSALFLKLSGVYSSATPTTGARDFGFRAVCR